MPGASRVYDFVLPGLEGQPIPLEQFRGRKMLIVNTASECGFTAQYAQLQELHDQFGDQVAIIGCPSNDFGNQEPGDNGQIALFCHSRFGVTFPLSARLPVKGPEKHPLFAWLEAERPEDGEIQWNFQKFLIDENGVPSKVFAPSVEPLSDAVLDALGLS